MHPSSALRRTHTAVSALFDLARNPNRLDRVLALGEAVNMSVFPTLWAAFQSDPEGKQILEERPAIDSAHVDLAALEALPDGTLGREYVRFLRDNGVTPDVFKPLTGGDPQAMYLAQRLRQSHDLWHVVTGYKPDVNGEVLLQAFTYAQTRAPSALLITLLGTARYGVSLRHVRNAYRRGRRAHFFGTVRWERRWERTVATLRTELDCPALAA